MNKLFENDLLKIDNIHFTLENMFKTFARRNRLSHLFQKSFKTFETDKKHLSTAGIIVIGDEILKGEVLDTNSHYLTSRLHELGVTVKKISIVGDNVQEISREIRWFSIRYKYVITSGGIGPTHDDVTFEAAARAFGEPIVINEELKKKCFEFYNTSDPQSPGMKLAKIPKTAKLNYKDDIKTNISYPNVSINNVYMFPGIPELLRRSFDSVGAFLFKSQKRFYSKILYCNLTEEKLAGILDRILQNHPNVQIGSYPKLYDDYKVKITIESTEEKATAEAYAELLQMLPKGCIVKDLK